MPHPLPQADDVKALLSDATSPVPSEADMQSKILTKSAIASTGLTAAGASLLSSEYLKDTRAELADGSELPLWDKSGTYFGISVPYLDFTHTHMYTHAHGHIHTLQSAMHGRMSL